MYLLFVPPGLVQCLYMYIFSAIKKFQKTLSVFIFFLMLILKYIYHFCTSSSWNIDIKIPLEDSGNLLCLCLFIHSFIQQICFKCLLCARHCFCSAATTGNNGCYILLGQDSLWKFPPSSISWKDSRVLLT